MSDALFVVGYYRSGTSALSGALASLGVKFYNDADPNEHNPLGFYEIPELIEFDVDLFVKLGVDWTDVRGLQQGWWERPDLAAFSSRLDGIIRRRFGGNDRVWGLKHPHLCRTLPIYERVVRQAGHRPHVVHIFRDPWTAASSQQLKNGLSRAHALLLWMSYVTSAEAVARHLPRSWLTYHDLLADPLVQIGRVESELNLDLCGLSEGGGEKAVGYLTQQLNRSEPLNVDTLYHPLNGLVARTWEMICTRDLTAQRWDDLSGETNDIVSFLLEIGNSRGRVIPALGGSLSVNTQAHAAVAPANLRPGERLDDGGRARLAKRVQQYGRLPTISVVVVAPKGRAAAVTDTVEALRAQLFVQPKIVVLASDNVVLRDVQVEVIPDGVEAATVLACQTLNNEAKIADYVAIINAGDTIAPDACARFASVAADSAADMIYCDEVVPREGGGWVRYKPAWDVTRLRQAAYVGDWVWYAGRCVSRLGGFDSGRAGAEEYDFQLRVAASGGTVVRLAETLFTRCVHSQRDDIKAEMFCFRAAEALKLHLEAAGLSAIVQSRQYMGLFHHVRVMPDRGTSTIIDCDKADVSTLDALLSGLLSGAVLTGPIILCGSVLSPEVGGYFAAVQEQTSALQGRILAITPEVNVTRAAALRGALSLIKTEFTTIIDCRAVPLVSQWAEVLRTRFADEQVAVVAGRLLVSAGKEGGAPAFVHGPIIIGADTRLGAGHLVDDPGPGGWLLVDQEVSAVAPPGLMARTEVLQACLFPELHGDALWIDLCAQIRAGGRKIVWTPDVSFAVPGDLIETDAACAFRCGSEAARQLPWIDPYHHPALSLHGDLLAGETRTGLVRSIPADGDSIVVSGEPQRGAPVLNAARAVRRAGLAEADWVPELPGAADMERRAPSVWVRANPKRPAQPGSPAYTAIFSAMPDVEAKEVLTEARNIFATSPGLVNRIQKLSPATQRVTLWRPALSGRIWADLEFGRGMNSKPRILWVDEGIAPPWQVDLINATLDIAAWIVVERPGMEYSGSLARIAHPESEYAWAKTLAELGPQLMVRPVGAECDVDHYLALMAAAAGCRLFVDERLDMPESLGAVRLPNRLASWDAAVRQAIGALPGTLMTAKRTREAALALPSLEECPPEWMALPKTGAASLQTAAE